MRKIRHLGTVKKIENGLITVEIEARSACASCESKTMCQMSERKEKMIDIPITNANAYVIGQSVNVVMQAQLGLKAVFWAYLMPFLVCIVALFGLSAFFDDESIFGVGAILAAAGYFVILKIFSKRLTRHFVWSLEIVGEATTKIPVHTKR